MTPRDGRDGTLRTFLAFEVPEEIRDVLKRETDRLRPGLPAARWVRPAGIHLTVKFLGSVTRERLDQLNGELTKALRDLPPVRFELGGAGFFPSPKRPRVAWVGGWAVGVEPVVDRVESLAAICGFNRERRPWRVHLTLARLRRPWPHEATERWLAWGRDVELPAFTAGELVCFSSDLRPDGAVYHPVQRMPFKGAANED